jgi:hypothetical protein
MAKKKMNYTPYILGVGALAAVGFIFKDDIKKLFKKSEDTEPVIDENLNTSPGIGSGVKNEPNRGGGGGGGINIVGITKGLSGMGTPKDRLNLNQILKQGDNGQEVAKLQQILNRCAKLYKLATIKETGNFGVETESKLTKIYGAPTINLFKAYAMLFAIYNAQKNNDSKNWYKKYFEPYLEDAVRYRNARSYYFDKNQIL